MTLLLKFMGKHEPDHGQQKSAAKVNNRNIRKRCEICSKLAIKTPERRY